MAIRFNINQGVFEEIYGDILGTQGLYQRVDIEGGRPMFYVGRRGFKTPGEAFSEVERLGMSNYVHFDPEQPMKSIGSGRFHLLEEMLYRIQQYGEHHPEDAEVQRITQNISIDRIAFGKEPKHLRNMYRDLMRRVGEGKARQSHGWDIPGFGDSPNVTLRFYAGEEPIELTSQQIGKLMDEIGIDMTNIWKDDAEKILNPKTLKRWRTLIDDSTYFYKQDTPFRIHMIDPENLDPDVPALGRLLEQMKAAKLTEEKVGRTAAERALSTARNASELREMILDGISVINPKVLNRMVDQLSETANAQLSVEGTRNQGRKLMDDVRKLRRHINEGGSFEMIRALGLQSTEMERIVALVKGDPLGMKWANWETLADALGVDPEKTDIIVGGAPPNQLGINMAEDIPWRMGASISLKPNEANDRIWLDIESAFMHPEMYDPRKIQAYHESVLRSMTDEFLETRHIPKDFKEYLEMVIAKEPDEKTNLLSLDAQKRRAQLLLDKEMARINPRTDYQYAMEYFNSLSMWIKEDRPGEPKLFAPATVGGHLRPAWLAEESKVLPYHLEPGQLGFLRGVADKGAAGVYISTADTIRTNPLHGGWDFDDLLRAHTYIATDEEGVMLRDAAGGLKVQTIGIRNPVGMGEISAFTWHSKALEEVTYKLGEVFPKYKPHTRLLEARGELEKIQDEVNETLRKVDQAVRASEDDDVIRGLNRESNRALRSKTNKLAQIQEIEEELTARGVDPKRVTQTRVLAEMLPTLSQSKINKMNLLGPLLLDEMAIPIQPNKAPIYIPEKAWLKKKGWKDYMGPILEIDDEVKASEFAFDTVEAWDKKGAIKAARGVGVDVANAHGMLGQFRNLEMVIGSLRPQIEARIAEGTWTGPKTGFIPLPGATEDILDLFSQGDTTKIELSEARKLLSEMVYGVAEGLSQYDLKLDPAAYRRLAGPRKRGALFKLLKEQMEEIDPSTPFREGKMVYNMANADEAEKAYISWMHQMADESRKWFNIAHRKAYGDALELPEVIRNTSYTTEEIYEAARLASTFNVAQEQLKESLVPSFKFQYQKEVMEQLEGSIQTVAAAQVRRMTSEIEGFYEPTETEGRRVMSDKGRRIINALHQQYGRSHSYLLSGSGIGDLAHHARMDAETRGGLDLPDDLTDDERRMYDRALAAPEEADPRPLRHITYDDEGWEGLVRDVEAYTKIEEGGLPGGAVRQSRLSDAEHAAETVMREGEFGTNFQQVGLKELKDFAKKPLVKRVGLGVAALVAGSYIYRKVRDRTPEDMQGPPLLPGGSAYENYPSRGMPPALSSQSPLAQGQGVTYRVTARGGFDEGDFRSQAEGIAGASSSGTIYNARNISKFGKDTLNAVNQQFGGSF